MKGMIIMEKWQEEGYVEKENGLLEKVVVKNLVQDETCSLWFKIYHVGNKVDYDVWPDGSWYELEICNAANASFSIENKMRIDLVNDEMDNMLEFIMEAKPILKKAQKELEEIRENY